MTEKEKVINVALNEVGYREKETNANLEDYLISGKVFLIKAIKESGGE